MWKARSRVLIGLALWTATVAAQTVTGSGTTNTVPVFTGSSTVSNSPILVSGSNVGIGTTNPQYPMDLAGSAHINSGNIIFSTSYLDAGGNTGIQANPNGWTRIDPNGSRFLMPVPASRVSTADNILDIERTDTWQHLMELHADGSAFWLGNVGIGTTSPGATLTTYTGGSGLANPSVVITKTYSGGGDNVPEVEIFGTDTGIANTGMYITQKGTGGFGGANGFVWEAVANGNPVMYQGFNGNVGIGTTNPQAKLEINGNLRFTSDGSVQTTAWTGVLCGGDYAEAVDASGDRKHYEPGDVLVLGDGNGGDVERSAEPYSTMVAGIFATKPGVVGRRETLSKSDQEIPMAMIGIVPAKVSTENGPIRRGDLLVTSSTPGYAMKGTDRARLTGAVIGKAMGSLDSGKGIIEVLVTLQ